MKTWKISNISNQPVKVACKTNSSGSIGIIIEPNHFCVSDAQITTSLDIQERRNFVSIERDFDNSKLNLEMVKSYSEEDLKNKISELEKSDFEKAAENVDKYIKNSEE